MEVKKSRDGSKTDASENRPRVCLQRRETYPVSRWSGGSTAEIFIWPPKTEYAKRNFMFRISSATVEEEISTFTYLPGIRRILMLLHGQIRLKTDGMTVNLKPYEQFIFNGEADTVSCGHCRDFNLMMANGCDGNLEVLDFSEQNRYNKNVDCRSLISGEQIRVLYASAGSCVCRIKDALDGGRVWQEWILQEADSLVLEFPRNLPEKTELEISGNSGNRAVLVCAAVLTGG